MTDIGLCAVGLAMSEPPAPWRGFRAAVPPVAGGEMGERIRAMDWSKTPIGPMEGWSPALRTMVGLLLANRFPMLLWWGPDYISLYNDAYRSVLGAKHPWALGTPVRECWSEIWHVLKPLIDAPFEGGPPTWSEDLAVEINRHGFLEETHFTVAYSPVPDESAPRGIGGVLATVHELTEKVVGERRIIALRDLGAHSGKARTAEEACEIAVAALGSHAKDVPFAALYLFDEGQKIARLAGTTGVAPGDPAAPVSIAVETTREADRPWPVAELLRSESTVVIEGLARRLAKIPAGPWPDPPHTAVLVPIKSNVAHQLAGFLLAGVSPRLRLDEQYHSFFELAASQIATIIATARAYEEERKRAEALAEIDRAKTMFFSNVSHEFRTPLTLMLGPLEDALSGPLPEGQRGRLAVAHRNALRLLKLVNSLLDYSRIEAGRAKASYEPVDLATFTAELSSNFRSACERAGLELVVDCVALPGPVHIDRDMWEKIVFNLLSNAFKFTFEGRIVISLRAVDGAAELAVRDTGVGIPEHELPRLFERFHRIEGQKSRTHEGSGIGLALVHELIKLHHGTIRAESRPGLGTNFIVTIPLGTAHLPADRIGAAKRLSATSVRAEAYVQEALRWLPDSASTPDAPDLYELPNGVPPMLAGAHVLVADDNADMRAYVRRLLEPYCHVIAVADGEAALEAVRERRPDLVLTDAMMPRLDGFGLVRAIREDEGLRDLPIIMLSARAGEESRIEGLNAGVDEYLVKPFPAREFIARVSSNLKLAQVRREANEALRKSEAQLRAYLSATFDAVFRLNADWSVMRQLAGKAFIFDTTEPSSTWLDEYIYPDDQTRVMEAARHAMQTKSAFELEHRILRIDGSVGWALSRAIPLLDERGEIVEWFGTTADVTARKRYDDRQRLLRNELNHRVKNTLATVHSIAVQTLRNSNDVIRAREMIGDRLVALSKAHDILTREHWEGAYLDDAVREVIRPHLGAPDDRFDIDGAEVWLPPKYTLALGLALHELCTNATKYGALSNDAGRVRIEWAVEGSRDSRSLRMRWSETGGPPVAPPARRGFGSRLIERGLRQDLNGQVTLDFAASGVVCMINTPMPKCLDAGLTE